MQINLLEYLENTVKTSPDKLAYSDGTEGLSFSQVHARARAVGSFLCGRHYKEPVVVFMGKRPDTIAAFLGALYAGCFYVPIDEEMPRRRIELIFETLNPGAVICDEKTQKTAESMNYEGNIYIYGEICDTLANEAALANVRDKAIDTDPVYVVFTSGSTGVPKGVAACHRSVIDYVESLSDVLKTDETTVFGMQVPLYVDACLKELYPTLKFGATAYLIPKSLFMFPLKLVEYLNTYEINTVCWVVSALTMISGLGALEKAVPRHLRTIAFGSEVFSIKQFNLWRKHLPEARFINLYGPTEATGMSCFYEVDREFATNEAIPIGKPFRNTEILLIDNGRQVTTPEQPGEIYIRGTGVTLGYYGDFTRTNEAFVQNPLNDKYPEMVYRTGDLGKYNAPGELVYISRTDYQIKHMGHRIELAEIEAAADAMPELTACCCVYDDAKGKIALYYTGRAQVTELAAFLKQALPRYMQPSIIEWLDEMPLTQNGKLDRAFLKNAALTHGLKQAFEAEAAAAGENC